MYMYFNNLYLFFNIYPRFWWEVDQVREKGRYLIKKWNRLEENGTAIIRQDVLKNLHSNEIWSQNKDFQYKIILYSAKKKKRFLKFIKCYQYTKNGN